MPRLQISAPAVVSEIIDGEAVIMNLDSGHYFSTRNTGAVVWANIERSVPIDAISRTIVTRYSLDKIEADRAIAKFVGDLLEHGLVREVSDAAVHNAVDDAAGWPAEWSVPQIEVFTDMEDLLLLDPIHDVSDAGWPMPLPENHST